jgi:hypothetical protein
MGFEPIVRSETAKPHYGNTQVICYGPEGGDRKLA